MKNIYLLGATGSIGRQTLDIIKDHPDTFKLVAISGYHQLEALIDIASRFSPELICVGQTMDAKTLKNLFPDISIVYGASGLVDVATFKPDDPDALLVNALVGMVGLRPTLAAIDINRDILLANKETLVVGGHLIQKHLASHPVKLYPLDSEHSAIWQILNGEKHDAIKRLIITASGGPFRDLSREQLTHVTRKDALNHPNWSMGAKITIDSATMMNKGFEIIEAAYLFNLDIDKITTVIHRESIVHSLVEFVDHAMVAQLASHDMRLPISYALFYPERVQNATKPLNLERLGKLHFETLDEDRYPLLTLAIKCFKTGGSARTALNAANEAAVHLFLNDKIHFLDIERIVIETVRQHHVIDDPSLEDIERIDTAIKQEILSKYDH